MLLETTTHVRVFRGSAPMDGSQQIHRMSPRMIGGSGSVSSDGWTRWPSRFFVIQQLQLCGLQVSQELPSVAPARRIVAGELALSLQRLSPRDGFANQLPSER